MAADTPREITTILVATDISPESAGAVLAARALADRLHARLHAVHVVEHVPESAERAMPGLGAAKRRHAEKELGHFAGSHGLQAGAGLRVREGSPVREVLLEAHAVGADVIVVGRKGLGAGSGAPLGGIADRIVRLSPVSVLVVPSLFERPFERIGAATDFSEGSASGLRRAAGLGAALGQGEIAILHAFEVPAGHHMIASWEDACKRLQAVAQHLAREQCDAALGSAVRTRIRVEEGSPGTVIPRLAAEEKLDLLVLSAHSRSRAATAMLGHTSERIIRATSCAVWAEKEPGLVQGVLEALREWTR